mgnify:CR=1 FL=1
MEGTYPETIKYFPSTKLADKSPLATLLLTKSTMKLFQVSEYLKYKNFQSTEKYHYLGL